MPRNIISNTIRLKTDYLITAWTAVCRIRKDFYGSVPSMAWIGLMGTGSEFSGMITMTRPVSEVISSVACMKTRKDFYGLALIKESTYIIHILKNSDLSPFPVCRKCQTSKKIKQAESGSFQIPTCSIMIRWPAKSSLINLIYWAVRFRRSAFRLTIASGCRLQQHSLKNMFRHLIISLPSVH